MSGAARRWLLIVALGIVVVTPCRAQEPEPDADLARQEWNERIRVQRERIEQMRREGRSFVYARPSPDQLAEERVRDAFDDPSLVPGDVVVTPRGLYRYRGTPDNRERQPGDFVLIETQGAANGRR